MRFFSTLLAICLLSIIRPGFAQKNIRLTSPDGNLVFSFRLTSQAPVYQVAYRGKTLIEESEMGFVFKENGKFGMNLAMSKPRFSQVDETYELIVGKTKTARNNYRQVLIPLTEPGGAKRKMNLVVRAYNDGMAFRHEFPVQNNWTSYSLTEERTHFKLAGDPVVYTLFFGSYTSSHEGLYHQLPFSQVKPDTLMDMPTLFEFPQQIYLAITEANLRNYAGMYLSKRNGMLHSQLSPLPGQTEIKVKATLPHQTPWRVMLISDRIGDLIESNLLTSLNEATKIKDLSWIKPGKTSFHWWNGDVIPDTTFAPGINFETNKYYIDFCARNQIEYHAVIGYGGTAWYVNDGISYQPGPNSDVTKPVPGLDMQQICDYASQQGVGIHVWVHWKALYPKLEAAFAQFEQWGVKGLMVDFMDRDDQEMVNMQEEILRKAAEHKLYIQFHGAFKPTGLHRTYPNEFTREGTHNYEQNKWSLTGISAAHDLMIPFTRMLAGATDYHLGGFRAVPKARFKTQYTRPLMAGTRCHMLAMYVVVESYLAMVSDYPAAYEGQAGFEFLKQVPTSWDETRVLDARIGEYVTIARRKGNSWYVGSLNNHTNRTIKVSMNFLPPGNYIAEQYSDARDVDQNPNHLLKQSQSVTSKDTLTIELAAGGGQVMRIVAR